MGSAVNKEDLTRELQRYHDAGLGGVEITPIYGVRGREQQFIDYLSPQWMDMLKYTIQEAKRLHMEVDMPACSGWCFGGPNVSDRDANASVMAKTFYLNAGEKIAEKFDPAETQALVAFSSDGQCIELTKRIAANGTVRFSPQPGSQPWRVYAISQKPSGIKVKRPGHGGKGWMLNLLYPEAMERYLKRFEVAFHPEPTGSGEHIIAHHPASGMHAMFHDSYEYKSDWAPDFFAQFEKRRGYRLQTELPALLESKGDSDHVARVKCDYRETISDLIVDSIRRWTEWSHIHKLDTRNQAHGSPGNWLDIYDAADIPETEMFHKDRDILVSKFASSAGHLKWGRRTSAETGTWVSEHFTETLADLKYLIDDLALAGVNRFIFHGTAYSPSDADWPGWLFYASAEVNPRNSIWRDLPALNAYAGRLATYLEGFSDNDILLYWPIYDRWHDSKGMVQQFTVHAREWFHNQSIGVAAKRLWDRGFTFDYISDRGLTNVKIEVSGKVTVCNQYRVIVVPTCERMPVGTVKNLLALAAGGATVIFENHLPRDVPGFGDLENRRKEFRRFFEDLKPLEKGDFKEARFVKGRILIGDLEAALAHTDVRREPIADHPNIRFVRTSWAFGHDYFIANRGTQRFEDWVKLNSPATSVSRLDLMTGQADPCRMRGVSDQTTLIQPRDVQVHLRLEPGESVVLRTQTGNAHFVPSSSYWMYRQPALPIELTGTWSAQFIEGGPELPKPFETDKLASWTELGGDDAKSFAGTARYTLTFDAPDSSAFRDPNSAFLLDLGKVVQSARVRLNGSDLGTLIIPPFRVAVDHLKPKGNVLEVEVTNTSANRIRDLDVRKVPWKIFHDINVVNLDYKPFNASSWPVADSGLLGPVTLTPLENAP